MPTSEIRGSSLPSPAISLPPLRSYLAEQSRRPIEKDKFHSNAEEGELEFDHILGMDERSSDYHAVNTDEDAGRRGKKRRYYGSLNVQRSLKPKLPGPSTAVGHQYSQPNLSPSQTLTFNSNYQCNLGKDLPELGLSYPETFYAKIREKRERHKNAEKSRRDRMKKALESLSKVLPQRGASDIEDNVRSSPSRIPHEDKAALIQAAVLYIEELQQELKDMKLKLE